MTRRTALKAWDKRLLKRIRRGKWSAAELQWVLTHLDQRTPTLVVQEIHEKLIALAKPAEIRLFLRGQLATGRTQELHSGLLAAGIPL